MRTKSLIEPKGIEKGHYWFSPDGHSPSWARVWNGTEWRNYEEEDVESDFINPESLEEIEIEVNDDKKPSLTSPLDERDDMEETEDMEEEETSAEDQSSEQSVSTEISDSDRGEQGTGGKPEPEPKQRGKRGKVRKGGKG